MKQNIRKLLSLPANLVNHFHDITHLPREEWFCTSDPTDAHVGSGGGSVWLLKSLHRQEAPQKNYEEWLAEEKKILIHAGGQSRRLPAYAPMGKALIPIPVFRWKRGQHFDQTLLDLQLPFYTEIIRNTPQSLHTLIVSGDVWVNTPKLGTIPEADVVCFGLWENPSVAQHHGVFCIKRNTDHLDFMLQKPTDEELAQITATHYYLIDVGLWLLSDKAITLLTKRSTDRKGEIAYYDLYSDFGRALGTTPTLHDEALKDLSVAIVPLTEGKFYHFGTSRELISSTTNIMNLAKDQRLILQQNIKKHPSIFTQNAMVRSALDLDSPNIWIENAYVPQSWKLTANHIITGIPQNNWNIKLEDGQCIDIIPIGEECYVLRPYGINDAFRGATSAANTSFIGQPFPTWAAQHGVQPEDLGNTDDLQAARLFPLCHDMEEMEQLAKWFFSPTPKAELYKHWKESQRLSADEITQEANLLRLYQQRNELSRKNLSQVAKNFSKSVFYQLDLAHTAHQFATKGLPLPQERSEDLPTITRAQDAMFRSEYYSYLHKEKASEFHAQAFRLMQQEMITIAKERKQHPQLNIHPDQIVWARSAVRIDLAGGWTDTPPYSLIAGGNVVNIAIELNGQQPLQVYIRPNKNFNIVCYSIDMGTTEVLHTYEDIRQYNKVGSAFSIPRAALALAGFLPDFCSETYSSLQQQLENFGAGLDITLLAAIPAGSGLGTSSILSSAILSALSDCCGLSWTKNHICELTLILEQMLTTGGGWQDQYGGILHGAKLLQTTAGVDQKPMINWLPETLFHQEDYRACHLLYYTGITRTAKNILEKIVRNMFLNEAEQLRQLEEMKQHAIEMSNAIMKNDLTQYGQQLRTTWTENCKLDKDTCPPLIAQLCNVIDDYCLGYKLPGAGGGGYMYMVAKDAQAASLIRQKLTEHPITPSARFVEMNISAQGLQISRS